jgi:hypothetical protein
LNDSVKCHVSINKIITYITLKKNFKYIKPKKLKIKNSVKKKKKRKGVAASWATNPFGAATPRGCKQNLTSTSPT